MASSSKEITIFAVYEARLPFRGWAHVVVSVGAESTGIGLHANLERSGRGGSVLASFRNNTVA